jgi:glyoxylate/hydroxypyruvate reductase A
MALALFCKVENPDLWRRAMTAEIPGLDFRVAPNLGDATQIRMAAFDYKVPNGTLATMPNLGCIVYLGHGAGDFLLRPHLPRGVPVMRLKDPGIIACMTEYVLLYLLSHRRFEGTYRRYQAERGGERIPCPFLATRIAILGLGSLTAIRPGLRRSRLPGQRLGTEPARAARRDCMVATSWPTVCAV